MSDHQSKRIPISDLTSEDGAHELATSPDMQPYLQLIMAETQGKDTTPHLRRALHCRWGSARQQPA